MAAATNGDLASPVPLSASSTSTLKRKRSNSTSTTARASTFASLQKDILGILRSYDTKPSLLEQPLHDKQSAPASEEHASKREKTAAAGTPDSIASRLQDGTYASLDTLMDDVETASTHVLRPYKKDVQDNNVSTRYTPPSLEETRVLTGILAFKKILKNMILREVAQRPSLSELPQKEEDVTEDTKGAAVKSPTALPIREDEVAASRKKVLTIFANAQGPKTLFSSLQQPAHVDMSKPTEAVPLDISVDVTLPMTDSSGLPGMIRITDSIPVQAASKRIPTFGELFAPPASVPQLSPPKPAKPLTTKGSTVTWVPGDAASKTRRKGKTFFSQPLAVGQWLSYSGVDAPLLPTSPEAKIKHRQRALSTGEARPPMPASAVAALQQAKEDALFRSAFSSFAPTHDDAVAIVPAEIKNRVWWQKVGSNKFTEDDEIPLDPALFAEPDEDDKMEVDIPLIEIEDEDKAFKEIAENYEPDDLETALGLKRKENQEVDSVLKEISELIETLHSHQRIRNSTLAGNLRTPVNQTASAALFNGTPSSPSSAEIDVYNMLKSQLTLMISTLPPYAVAKLNGDQLAELNISRNLVVETKSFDGVLEEDQLARMAKQPPVPAMGATPSRTPAGAPPGQYNQYARGVPTTPHGPPSRNSTYYPQQQGPTRTPSVQYHRPANNATPGYPQSAHRGSYAQTPNNYGQPNVRGGYGQQPGYYQNNRPPPQGYSMPQQQQQGYHNSPAAAPNTQPRNYQQPTHAYPSNQRPQNVAPMYNNYSQPAASPHMRNASPLKPAPTPSHQHQQQYSSQQSPPRPGSLSQPPLRPSSSNAQHTPQSQPQPGTPSTSAADRARPSLGPAPPGRNTPQALSRQASGTPQLDPNGGSPMET